MATVSMAWSDVDAALRDVFGDLYQGQGAIVSYALGKEGLWLHLGLWVPKKGGGLNLYSSAKAASCLEYMCDHIMEKGVPNEQNIVVFMQHLRATFGTTKA